MYNVKYGKWIKKKKNSSGKRTQKYFYVNKYMKHKGRRYLEDN